MTWSARVARHDAVRAGLQAVLLDREGAASKDDLCVIASLDDLTFTA